MLTDPLDILYVRTCGSKVFFFIVTASKEIHDRIVIEELVALGGARLWRGMSYGLKKRTRFSSLVKKLITNFLPQTQCYYLKANKVSPKQLALRIVQFFTEKPHKKLQKTSVWVIVKIT